MEVTSEKNIFFSTRAWRLFSPIQTLTNKRIQKQGHLVTVIRQCIRSIYAVHNKISKEDPVALCL